MRTLAALTPASSARRSEETVPISCIGGLEQRPVVERQAGDRRLRDAPSVGNGASSAAGVGPGLGRQAYRLCARFLKVSGRASTLRAAVVGRRLGVRRARRCRRCSRRRCSCGTPATTSPRTGPGRSPSAMFALASAALATGTSTGWDNGTFRVFYLLGAVRQRALARPRHRLPAAPRHGRPAGSAVGARAASAGSRPGCC